MEEVQDMVYGRVWDEDSGTIEDDEAELADFEGAETMPNRPHSCTWMGFR